MTRHDRYFKKIVVVLLIIFLVIIGDYVHTYYKDRAERIGEHVKQIESYRGKLAVLPALNYLKSLGQEDFWRVWPFLNKNAQHLEAPFYYEFARRYAAESNIEETLFWLYLGRFSLTYDALRCEQRHTAIEWKLWFDQQLSFDLEPIMIEGQKEALNAQALKRVLEFDQERTAHAQPFYLCAYAAQPYRKPPAYTVTPAQQWRSLRTNLRNSAARLVEMNKK